MSFDSSLFIVLLYLIRKEGIKDLIHHLGRGCFSWSLAVLLDLCWVTDGLSSGSSPINRISFFVHLLSHKHLIISGVMAL